MYWLIFLVHSAVLHSTRVIMQLQESFRVDLLHWLLEQRASHPDLIVYITINSNLGALESKVRTKWIVLCCYLQTALFICQKSFLRAGRLCWIEGNRLICDSLTLRASAPKLNICHFIWHPVGKHHILHNLILKDISTVHYYYFLLKDIGHHLNTGRLWSESESQWECRETKYLEKKNWALMKALFFMKENVEYSVCFGQANNGGVEVSSG